MTHPTPKPPRCDSEGNILIHPGWITNRLPAEADADADGDVRIPLSVDAAMSSPERSAAEIGWTRAHSHHGLIVPGQPWWSEEAAANPAPPATSPAPAPTRKVVQIAVESPPTEGDYAYIYALCNDGTILFHGAGTDQPWRQLPPIPQPE
jgi:hypothetical protein